MAAQTTYFSYNSPIGIITIAQSEGAITNLSLGKQIFEGARKPHDLTNRAASQLQEYFAGKRTVFDLPLQPQGTSFQRSIWAALQEIPYGETQTFQQLAILAGETQAHRAAGVATKKNPIPIIIPDHRAVTASGKPSGSKLQKELARHLIELERSFA